MHGLDLDLDSKWGQVKMIGATKDPMCTKLTFGYFVAVIVRRDSAWCLTFKVV